MLARLPTISFTTILYASREIDADSVYWFSIFFCSLLNLLAFGKLKFVGVISTYCVNKRIYFVDFMFLATEIVLSFFFTILLLLRKTEKGKARFITFFIVICGGGKYYFSIIEHKAKILSRFFFLSLFVVVRFGNFFLFGKLIFF